MPSQLLHTLFGEDVSAETYKLLKTRMGEERFDTAAKKVLEDIQNTHKKMFALGCQGPDIFYHSQVRRPVGLEYGTLLHRRGVGTLTALLLKTCIPDKKKSDDALRVYIMGFMTHAILDREAHPYIVYKSDRPPPETKLERSHAFFERIIDVLMLKHLRGAEIISWDQDGMLSESCKKAPAALKELLHSTLVQAYPERAGKDDKLKDRIENTFLDCAEFYHLTAPANTMVKKPVKRTFAIKKGHVAYLYPEELPTHIDFLNMKKRPWYYPAGESKEDTRSFPEIYCDAVNLASDSLLNIIVRSLEHGNLPIEEAAAFIGNGGLSIVDENGKPCALTRTEPLPLGEVLDEQAAMRKI